MFDPRKSVSSSLEPTTNLGVELSPSVEVVRDDIAALVANHPVLESQCAKRDGESQKWGEQAVLGRARTGMTDPRDLLSSTEVGSRKRPSRWKRIWDSRSFQIGSSTVQLGPLH